MADQLKIRRRIVKGKVSRFKTHLDSVKISNDLSQLPYRLDRFREFISEFEAVQSAIELAIESEDSNYEERISFYDTYFGLLAEAESILSTQVTPVTVAAPTREFLPCKTISFNFMESSDSNEANVKLIEKTFETPAQRNGFLDNTQPTNMQCESTHSHIGTVDENRPLEAHPPQVTVEWHSDSTGVNLQNVRTDLTYCSSNQSLDPQEPDSSNLEVQHFPRNILVTVDNNFTQNQEGTHLESNSGNLVKSNTMFTVPSETITETHEIAKYASSEQQEWHEFNNVKQTTSSPTDNPLIINESNIHSTTNVATVQSENKMTTSTVKKKTNCHIKEDNLRKSNHKVKPNSVLCSTHTYKNPDTNRVQCKFKNAQDHHIQEHHVNLPDEAHVTRSIIPHKQRVRQHTRYKFNLSTRSIQNRPQKRRNMVRKILLSFSAKATNTQQKVRSSKSTKLSHPFKNSRTILHESKHIRSCRRRYSQKSKTHKTILMYLSAKASPSNIGANYTSKDKEMKGTRYLLKPEELQTNVKCNIACLKSYPLNPISNNSSSDSLPLAHGHFETRNALAALPEPIICHVPANRLFMWQQTQQLNHYSWARCSKEYWSNKQQRQPRRSMESSM